MANLLPGEDLNPPLAVGQRVIWRRGGARHLAIRATVVGIGRGFGRVTILVDQDDRKKVVARWHLEALNDG